MVIVDTSVWVQAFNAQGSTEQGEVDRLLAGNAVGMVGVVMAELLRVTRGQQEFEQLRLRLTALPYFPESKETWTQVGRIAQKLRLQGQTIPLPDVLIAALSFEHGHTVYTLDGHFGRIPGLSLHQPET
jgi:predicted nucleic acid-binding protein